jgi:opacity protein-like surface antigen
MKFLAPILLVISLFASQILKAQTPVVPWKISAAFGGSLPLGNFARAGTDSVTNQSAAKMGIAINGTISYQFNRSPFYIMLTGGWQQHKTDGKAIARALTTPGLEEVYAGTNSWHIWKILAGPGIRVPIGQKNRLGFEGGVAAGIVKTTIPDSWDAVVLYNNVIDNYSSGKIKLTGFCYQANAGLSYALTKSLSVGAHFECMHANPKHTAMEYIPPGQVYDNGQAPVPASKNVTRDYPISTFNALIGIGWSF